MGMEVGGLFGLIILVLDVFAIIKVVEARSPTSTKVLWIVLILLLPVLGLIIWWLFGRKA